MKRKTPKPRHVLSLTSHDLFSAPMGDGGDIDDLDDDQYREWQHQNTELFLRRLSHWKRLSKTRAATEALRAARTPDAIDDVWMSFRKGRIAGGEWRTAGMAAMTAAGRATGGR